MNLPEAGSRTTEFKMAISCFVIGLLVLLGGAVLLVSWQGIALIGVGSVFIVGATHSYCLPRGHVKSGFGLASNRRSPRDV